MRVLIVAALAAGVLFPAPQRSGQKRPKKPVLRDVVKAGPGEECVDVVFVGDGYRASDAKKFHRDVARYTKRFLKEEPFVWYRNKFNVRGAFVPSKDRGCDLSPSQDKVATVLESYFDSPRGRLLQFRNSAALDRIVRLSGDVDIVFVMVNTKKYGGAGTTLRTMSRRGRPLPAPTFAAQDSTSFLIAIHELGHSFAGLADEYVDKLAVARYRLPRKADLAAPNVTREEYVDTSSFKRLKATVKWKHFLSLKGAEKHKWFHEGGYFREKGIFRPWRRCRMRVSSDKFCPVCMEAMAKAIVKTCGGTWNARAYHKKHPLSDW